MAVSASRVATWDWPTRAFHWLLVFCLLSAWASYKFAPALGDLTLKWHRWNGFAILVLLVFRLIWGFTGSSTSRFVHFVKGPMFTLQFGLDFLRGRKRPYLGHNPLGTMMILMLLAALMLQAVLGLFTLEHNEIVAGPLKRLISDEATAIVSKLHVKLSDFILIFIVIHVVANIGYTVVAHEPLIRAMITGHKPALAYEDAPAAIIARGVSWRALIVLVVSIVLVFGGILLAGGRIF